MKSRNRVCILNSMNQGGAETFMMKLFRTSQGEIVFDVININSEKNFYDDEIISLGGEIHVPKTKINNKFQEIKYIKKIVKEKKYKNVIINADNNLQLYRILAAKKAGADNIIIRSMNTKVTGGFIKKILHKLIRPFTNKLGNIKIAPNTESAIHMFGKRETKKNVYIVNNGIDTNKFKFSNEKRTEKRKHLGLDAEYLIGHVGRFSEQKNHDYLLDVFYEYIKTNSNAKLLLIGKGDLKEKVKIKAKNLNILDKIIFKEGINNIQDYYMAMDVLVFPSLYEGLPNVVVEAQATGLPCLISNTISKEVVLTDLVNMLSIKVDSVNWAKKTDDFNVKNREVYAGILKEKGYDIEDVLNIFLKTIMGEKND